jgi:hypothetical protein
VTTRDLDEVFLPEFLRSSDSGTEIRGTKLLRYGKRNLGNSADYCVCAICNLHMCAICKMHM